MLMWVFCGGERRDFDQTELAHSQQIKARQMQSESQCGRKLKARVAERRGKFIARKNRAHALNRGWEQVSKRYRGSKEKWSQLVGRKRVATKQTGEKSKLARANSPVMDKEREY